jgi:CubicO group peptidase (beta-lactamase class C family)
MLTNQVASKYPVAGYGWGFGARLQVSASPAGTARAAGVGAYGWNGGTGTQFLLDPESKLIAIVFAPTWPGTPGVGQVRNDFTSAAIAAVEP